MGRDRGSQSLLKNMDIVAACLNIFCFEKVFGCCGQRLSCTFESGSKLKRDWSRRALPIGARRQINLGLTARVTRQVVGTLTVSLLWARGPGSVLDSGRRRP